MLTAGMAARGAHLWVQEAYVDPQEACAAMLAAAEARGAEVLLGPGQRVERLQVEAVADEQQEGRHGELGAGRRRVTGMITSSPGARVAARGGSSNSSSSAARLMVAAPAPQHQG